MRVIVITCDKYSHIIPVFWHFYRKNWPDNPWPTLIATNERHIETPMGAKVIYLGPDQQYGTNLKKLLRMVSDDFFILMQEDYILRWVDRPLIQEGFRLIQRGDTHCVRLYPMPGPDRPVPFSSDYGELEKNSQYSLSLQTSFWRRNTLRELLRDGETPWETELRGTYRVSKLPEHWRFLSSYKPALEYGQYCTGGKENEHEKKWVEENW